MYEGYDALVNNLEPYDSGMVIRTKLHKMVRAKRYEFFDRLQNNFGDASHQSIVEEAFEAPLGVKAIALLCEMLPDYENPPVDTIDFDKLDPRLREIASELLIATLHKRSDVHMVGTSVVTYHARLREKVLSALVWAIGLMAESKPDIASELLLRVPVDLHFGTSHDDAEKFPCVGNVLEKLVHSEPLTRAFCAYCAKLFDQLMATPDESQMAQYAAVGLSLHLPGQLVRLSDEAFVVLQSSLGLEHLKVMYPMDVDPRKYVRALGVPSLFSLIGRLSVGAAESYERDLFFRRAMFSGASRGEAQACGFVRDLIWVTAAALNWIGENAKREAPRELTKCPIDIASGWAQHGIATIAGLVGSQESFVPLGADHLARHLCQVIEKLEAKA